MSRKYNPNALGWIDLALACAAVFIAVVVGLSY